MHLQSLNWIDSPLSFATATTTLLHIKPSWEKSVVSVLIFWISRLRLYVKYAFTETRKLETQINVRQVQMSTILERFNAKQKLYRLVLYFVPILN